LIGVEAHKEGIVQRKVVKKIDSIVMRKSQESKSIFDSPSFRMESQGVLSIPLRGEVSAALERGPRRRQRKKNYQNGRSMHTGIGKIEGAGRSRMPPHK